MTDRLSNLPAELRNQIFSMCLGAPETIHRVVQNGNVRLASSIVRLAITSSFLPVMAPTRRVSCPDLMAVSSQLRHEVSAVYYAERRVFIQASVNGDLVELARWLSDIVTNVDSSMPFRHLTIAIMDCGRGNLDRIFPLVDLVRTTRFNHRHLAVDLEVNRQGRSTRVARAILDAMDLGARARREGWSRARLQGQFQAWLRRRNGRARRGD